MSKWFGQLSVKSWRYSTVFGQKRFAAVLQLQVTTYFNLSTHITEITFLTLKKNLVESRQEVGNRTENEKNICLNPKHKLS